jgi:Tol biopolymer transport system component
MKKLSVIVRAALLVVVLGLVLSGEAAAGNIRVSGVMPDFGAVQEFEVSPDGRYVVYRADQELDNAINIYSVELTGGSPVRLGSPMPAGSGVASFQISSDSHKVVYLAPSAGPAVLDLYSAPIGGPASDSVRLTNQLDFNQRILAYEVSPNNAWVVFISDHEFSDRFELYSVPIEGPASAIRKLNPSLGVDNGRVLDFQISPDSSRVIYRVDVEADGLAELYSAPISGQGSPVVKLNIPVQWEGVNFNYQISPDSSRVVYLAADIHEWSLSLFSVPLEGPASASIKLNRPLDMWEDRAETVLEAQISQDSKRVVYRLRALTWEGWNTWDLYSVPLNGTADDSIMLHEPFRPKMGVLPYLISPDSSRVVFMAIDVVILPNPSLFSVPIDGPGSEAVKLNEIEYPEGWVTQLKISPDSQRVVYLLQNWFQGAPEWTAPELYTIPIEGPASESVLLTSPFPLNSEMLSFEISPDSSRVVYLADQQMEGVFELFMVPARGPSHAAVKLNGPLVENGRVRGFSILPDSSRVVYMADQEVAERVELFMADDGLTEIKFTSAEMDVPRSSGLVNIAVELNQASALTVQVEYSARLGSDNSLLTSGTLTFLSGETSKEVELILPEYEIMDGEEIVVVSLSEAVNAVLAEPSTITVKIFVDDVWSIYLPLVER